MKLRRYSPNELNSLIEYIGLDELISESKVSILQSLCQLNLMKALQYAILVNTLERIKHES